MSLKDDFVDHIIKTIVELREKGYGIKMKNKDKFSQTIGDTYVSHLA
jgi:hypothetical protein